MPLVSATPYNHDVSRFTFGAHISYSAPISLEPPSELRRCLCSRQSTIFEFGLPDGRSLDLPVCASLLLRAGTDDGGDIVRTYTPITSNAEVGSFKLLVKIYDQGLGPALASQLLTNMAVGDTVEFKHTAANIKVQFPFAKNHISMICGTIA